MQNSTTIDKDEIQKFQAKADESISSIPIIALTAHALESDKQKALECGADDFDTKPVDFKRLLGKIEAFVGS